MAAAEPERLRGDHNLAAWLTTVVSRVRLNLLRWRDRRREEPLHVPDPLISPDSGVDPEQEALLADSVGLAPAAARQLASRARRRVQDQAPAPDPDPARQRDVVNAFFA